MTSEYFYFCSLLITAFLLIFPVSITNLTLGLRHASPCCDQNNQVCNTVNETGLSGNYSMIRVGIGLTYWSVVQTCTSAVLFALFGLVLFVIRRVFISRAVTILLIVILFEFTWLVYGTVILRHATACKVSTYPLWLVNVWSVALGFATILIQGCTATIRMVETNN